MVRGEDDYRQLRELWMRPNPRQHFEPIHEREHQVEKNNSGKRIFLTISENAHAGQILSSQLAIWDCLNWIEKPRLGKSSFEKFNVLLRVLHDENGREVLMYAHILYTEEVLIFYQKSAKIFSDKSQLERKNLRGSKKTSHSRRVRNSERL